MAHTGNRGCCGCEEEGYAAGLAEGQKQVAEAVARWLADNHGKDGAWYAAKIRATYGLPTPGEGKGGGV